MTDDPQPTLIPGQVRVVVEGTDRRREVLRTSVRVIEGEVPPDFAQPASLFRRVIGDGIELHRGTRTDAVGLTFTTFGAASAPQVGTTYVVQWWWRSGTLDMLTTATTWRRSTVTEHWFCPLTYDNLDKGDDAYTDDRGNWISVRGWGRFVRDDALRLRSG